MIFVLAMCSECLRIKKREEFVWLRGSAFEFLQHLLEEVQLRQKFVKEINLKIILTKCPNCGKEVS